MRRALKARDENCRFPGCTHQYSIDGHHIKHWSAGGETSLDNLVQLCRFHHRLVHEGGFGCERTDDGEILFTNECGLPINESGQTMPAFNGDVVVKLKERCEDWHINARSCVTRWLGERMDLGLAVGHLCQADRPGVYP